MTHQVAVRALCEFTAKTGSLDHRFSPAPSAQDGIAGHRLVTARRGVHYQAEVTLSASYEGLLVRGRADGYDSQLNQLEEIKTHRVAVDAIPENHKALHWAQAKMYAAMQCAQLDLPGMRVALVYFDIASEDESLLVTDCSALELRGFFEEQCQRYLKWADGEATHVASRNTAIRDMALPHAGFRDGQRELAHSVFNAHRKSCALLAQAPTGIGKSIGTVFPAVATFADHGTDKVFYLTAKGSGRATALSACRQLTQANPAIGLRVLELVAREKSCEYPGRACHGDACPLANGFYDRLPAARAAAVDEASEQSILDAPRLRDIARRHQVCPYYLGVEMARWTDVVVADYNYYFARNALLHSLTLASDWRTSVLVDEAHNLIERARAMYSAQLTQSGFSGLGASLPTRLKGAVARVMRDWNDLNETHQKSPSRFLPSLPDTLLDSVNAFCEAFATYLGEADAVAGVDSRLMQLYFDTLAVSRLCMNFGDHSVCELLPESGLSTQTVFAVRNIIPANFLAPRFSDARCAVLFSATLTPSAYYLDVLGLPEGTVCVDVASPFSADQVEVNLVSHLSTRYRQRKHTLDAICRLVHRQFNERPGNYLFFASSFDYLAQLRDHFETNFPQIRVWSQSQGMNDAARDTFLAEFTESGNGIGFAVLGGVFAEGVDLPGTRLVGAVIVTLGLPSVSEMTDVIRDRMEREFGRGDDYAYLYPGMQKVVQAAGRVIRSPQDRGVICLIDDRYRDPEVRALLPSWWARSG